ncbi:MAG TPA: superoxide dismutase family protein [Gillisia sp.]|nr:superoxide dismutase family protein [Gillisia sp.]
MKKVSFTLLFSAILVLSGCKNDKNADDTTSPAETNQTTQNTEREEVRKITVTIEPKSGSNLSGNAVFSEENGQVTMTAIIDGLSEGMHAIHLHESADCSAQDGSSAGGHWNPTAEKHGKWGDASGYHRGDIGNFKVDANGNGTITKTTDQWCIGCDDQNKNIVGKSLLIHDGVDDFTSQPAGDAGTRVGCGSIRM